MNERIKHSKLGMASTILPIGIWMYLGVSLFLFFQTDVFTKFYNSYLSSNRGGMIDGMGDLGVFVFLMLVLFIVVPVTGHLLGFILGLIGSLARTKKILFAVIGLFLNTFPFIVLAGLYLMAAWQNR